MRLYSKADSGVVDRVCSPGDEIPDGLNRYWRWNYSWHTDTQRLGRMPQRTEGLLVLGGV